MMTTPSNLQDCYFYFYSSCTKGDECPFRHCELALGSETVCSLWKEGRCFRSNCKFRHMESRIKRSTIPCYWENQPGGCRKPHCAFLHQKSRSGVQVIKNNPGLILPTSDSPKQLDLNEASNVACKLSPVEKPPVADAASDPSLVPVTPLVLSFDEGEESDTESVTSTPVKASSDDKKANSTRNNNLLLKASGSIGEKDFGIKTLEQIRMEKIHKESDSYYGAAYTSTPLDVPRPTEQHYPPKSEFLSLSKDSSLDKSLPAPITEPKLSGVDDEIDLRGRLSIRRNNPSNKVNPAKRLISFKKHNTNPVDESSNKLDFKIKTLDEIRKEKENKQSKSDVALNNTLGVLTSLEGNKPMKNPKEKTLKKLKINRKPKELLTAPAAQKHDVSQPNFMEIPIAPLVSNGIQKTPPRVPEPSETLTLNKFLSVSPGKRKSDDDTCDTASKITKYNNREQVNQVNGCSDETDKNHCHVQHSENQSPSSSHETSATSSIHPPTSPNHSQASVTDIETNGVSIATLSQNAETEVKSEKPSPISTEGVLRNDKENFIDRSMSVDEDLDELLGDDDINMDDMDATHSGDILLEIEEFLDS